MLIQMNFAMKIANNKQSNHVFEVTFQFRLHGENCVIYRTDTLNGTVVSRENWSYLAVSVINRGYTVLCEVRKRMRRYWPNWA